MENGNGEAGAAGRGELILVVCTGNSCRSQMAEGFLRELGGDRLRVASAGTEPAREIHPLAVRVMREAGVDLGGQKPKSYRRFEERREIGTVILVCDDAARSCPAVWPGAGEPLRWPFEDPAAFRGPEAEGLAKFRSVRDQIRRRVAEWLDESRPARVR